MVGKGRTRRLHVGTLQKHRVVSQHHREWFTRRPQHSHRVVVEIVLFQQCAPVGEITIYNVIAAIYHSWRTRQGRQRPQQQIKLHRPVFREYDRL
jgi:hypothetical protein